MIKKSISLLALGMVSFVSLTGCGNTSFNGESATSDSLSSSLISQSSEAISSSLDYSSPQPYVYKRSNLEKALAKDYSNMTIATVQAYDSGESAECATEYYYQDYTVVYDEQAPAEDPYLYYHDYEGKNYLHFDADPVGKKEAWLNKGYEDADLSLGHAYFSFQSLVANLDPTKAVYSSGLYVISDETEIAKLNETALSFAWNNNIKYLTLGINSEGYLASVIGLEELEDEKDFVKLQLGDFKTTSFNGDLPTPPNKDNVMEYWQYKGWSGPLTHTYCTSVTLKADEEGKKEADTYVLEIEEMLKISLLICQLMLINIALPMSLPMRKSLRFPIMTKMRKS